MLRVLVLTLVFSMTTSISIVLLGSRDLIGGTIGPRRLLAIVLDPRFIVGAGFAFASRLLFVMTNNAIAKIPRLASASTTITTLVNSAAIVVVIIVNALVLGERLRPVQSFGMLLILAGLVLTTR